METGNEKVYTISAFKEWLQAHLGDEFHVGSSRCAVAEYANERCSCDSDEHYVTETGIQSYGETSEFCYRYSRCERAIALVVALGLPSVNYKGKDLLKRLRSLALPAAIESGLDET